MPTPDYKPPTSAEELLARYAKGEREFWSVRMTGADLHDARLVGADLRGADLADANLRGAGLADTRFGEADLSGADASGANFIRSDLRSANLHAANLRGADLRGTNLMRVVLDDADVRQAQLGAANLMHAVLRNANMCDAIFGSTLLADVNLSNSRGLDKIRHDGPSAIDHRTIACSGELPLSFLRGVGLPEWLIDTYRGYLGKAIEFYSCFISYSHADEDVARRLHADLQERGVRCWFAPEDLKTGDVLEDAITGAIRIHEKLVLILSEHSVGSAWVKREVQTAQSRERKEGRPVLFPIRLDDAIKFSSERVGAVPLGAAAHHRLHGLEASRRLPEVVRADTARFEGPTEREAITLSTTISRRRPCPPPTTSRRRAQRSCWRGMRRVRGSFSAPPCPARIFVGLIFLLRTWEKPTWAVSPW